MVGMAIVAIPMEREPVWKYSSEKIPHMTLLFLGEQADNPALPHIIDYVGHLASMTKPFSMNVDRRGLLGPENADVLFFSTDKHGKAAADSARRFLLTDPEILKAYESVEQYPDWIPHLTMGFPGSPAKKDDRDYAGFSWIEFDHLALWTGDFTGPTFELKYPDLEEVDMVMSDGVENFFEHHGVMGMKWGRRKATAGAVEVSTKETPGKRVTAKGGENHPPSADAVRTAAYKQKAKASTTDALSNAELKDLVNRMNLEQQYANLAGSQKTTMQKGTARVKQILDTKQTVDRVLNDPTVKPFVQKMAADLLTAIRSK